MPNLDVNFIQKTTTHKKGLIHLGVPFSMQKRIKTNATQIDSLNEVQFNKKR